MPLHSPISLFSSGPRTSGAPSMRRTSAAWVGNHEPQSFPSPSPHSKNAVILSEARSAESKDLSFRPFPSHRAQGPQTPPPKTGNTPRAVGAELVSPAFQRGDNRPLNTSSPVGTANESGYILLGVLILLALFVIAMAVAAPRMAASIQRDREVETMQRGKQYIRAIQLYYRKFNAYPPSIDALVKTNEIRFLRKRYLDPMTGKDDWKTIQYCQNKAPIAMGFFGQPLGPTSGCGPLAGTGPSGGNGINGGSSLFPGQDQNGQQTNGQNGLTQNNGFQNNGQQNTGQQAGGQPGGTFASNGGSDNNGNGSTGMFGDNNNGGGQTFGGGGIIGVSPAGDKKSTLIYKKKDHYNQWEFTYSPLMDQQMMMGGNNGAGIGQPANGSNGSNGSGNNNGFGNNNNGFGNNSGFGGNGGPGGSPTPTPTPTPTPNPPQ